MENIPHLSSFNAPVDTRKRFSRVEKLSTKGDIYHIALEAKSQSKGDKEGKRGAIEEAATQVIRGVNGLINCLSSRKNILLNNAPPSFFVPVIFTTARLWLTDADLGEADLERGEISLDDTKVEEAEWLWIQYHLSPTLKHWMEREETGVVDRYKDTFGYLMTQEYTRGIAVVGPKGIESFLQQSRQWWQ